MWADETLKGVSGCFNISIKLIQAKILDIFHQWIGMVMYALQSLLVPWLLIRSLPALPTSTLVYVQLLSGSYSTLISAAIWVVKGCFGAQSSGMHYSAAVRPKGCAGDASLTNASFKGEGEGRLTCFRLSLIPCKNDCVVRLMTIKGEKTVP